MIGPWCFLDRFGPLTFQDQKPMDVAPHPHIGLQTLTWLFSGEVLHNDSLGSECMIRPGEISLMTAGKGIAHTEETPARNSGLLDGVQFWIALPEAQRFVDPSYLCTRELHRQELLGVLATSLVPQVTMHSEMAGFELRVQAKAGVEFPTVASHEHGVVLVEGDCRFADEVMERNTLYYLAPGTTSLPLRSENGAVLIVIGGAPFGEQILMWWNFVARTADEIVAARGAWERREEFGAVPGYAGERLAAPPLAGHLLKRGPL